MTTKQKNGIAILTGVAVIVIAAGILALFGFVSEKESTDKLQNQKIQTCEKDIDKHAENIEYLQKTLNVTNNTVTEIQVHQKNLATKEDLNDIEKKIDRICYKLESRNILITESNE